MFKLVLTEGDVCYLLFVFASRERAMREMFRYRDEGADVKIVYPQ